jgi:hypothetical protein
MKLSRKAVTSVLLCERLMLLPVGCGHRRQVPKTPLQPAVFNFLQEVVQKPYLDLFEEAPTLEFTPGIPLAWDLHELIRFATAGC